MPQKFTYKITEEALDKCWDFSVGYYLDPKKSVTDRTNYMNRGLGGIADSFMKKIEEIAVCEIIKKYNKDIVPMHDFEIHDLKENRTEPDIIRVFRPGYMESDYGLLKKTVDDLLKEMDKKKDEDKKLISFGNKQPKIKDCETEAVKNKIRMIKTGVKTNRKKIKTAMENLKKQVEKSKENILVAEKAIEPKLYVEIKNIDEGDAWIGPKVLEIESIKDRKGVNEKSIYYVYCSVIDAKGKGRSSDPLGVFLKNHLGGERIKKFHDVADLGVEIKNVMTAADIYKHGTKFVKGTIIPNPEIITEVTGSTCNGILKKIKEGKLTERALPNNKLPRETSSPIKEKEVDGSGEPLKKNGKQVWKTVSWNEYPPALGDYTFTGKIKAYSEVDGGVRHLWMKCISSVTFSNNVQGIIGPFKKDKLLDYKIEGKGRGLKKVDDIWIDRRNDKIMKKFPPERIREIADKI